MHSLKVVSHVYQEPGTVFKKGECAAKYSEACAQIDALIDCLSKPVPTLDPSTAALPSTAAEPEMVSNQGAEGYKKFVRDIREHIYEGNLIQAVPSQRLARPLRGVHAFDVYRELRVLNPSPYALSHTHSRVAFHPNPPLPLLAYPCHQHCPCTVQHSITSS